MALSDLPLQSYDFTLKIYPAGYFLLALLKFEGAKFE
jgi:hypothetical protein